MKKIVMILLAIAMTLGLSVGLIACNTGSTEKGQGAVSGAEDATQSSYGFSAATAGSILSAMQGGSAQQLAVAKGYNLARAEVTDEATIESLNDYMFLVEGLLGDGAFGMTTEASDRAEYAVKATVSYRDIEGNTLSYILYYNETERGGYYGDARSVLNTSADWDDRYDDDWDDRYDDDWDDRYNDDRYDDDRYDDDRYDDDWDDRYDDERVYDIDGVMLVDGAEYPIYGRTEAETEWDESESETQFVVQMSDTRTMVVTQEQENEGDEREEEYAYTIRENGRVVERCSFSFEQEEGETEIELLLTKDGQTQTFYFEQEGRRGIRIYVGSRQGGTAYTVRVETDEAGNSYYVYETVGGNYRFDRPDFD